jgi:hypothetical protein
VPAFRECTAPNRTHGAPLAFPSCNPPAQTSIYLTVGTPDANGAGAQSIGRARLDALSGDMRIAVRATDVRCLPSVSPAVCADPNSADGPDYSGNMELVAPTRISDHFNGSGLNEAATMFDVPLEVDVLCSGTASTSIGGDCSADTTYDAIVPNALQPGRRMVWDLGKLALTDGGADGDIHSGDPAGGVFLRQGLFVP